MLATPLLLHCLNLPPDIHLKEIHSRPVDRSWRYCHSFSQPRNEFLAFTPFTLCDCESFADHHCPVIHFYRQACTTVITCLRKFSLQIRSREWKLKEFERIFYNVNRDCRKRNSQPHNFTSLYLFATPVRLQFICFFTDSRFHRL